jgi:hypothetical protein
VNATNLVAADNGTSTREHAQRGDRFSDTVDTVLGHGYLSLFSDGPETNRSILPSGHQDVPSIGVEKGQTGNLSAVPSQGGSQGAVCDIPEPHLAIRTGGRRHSTVEGNGQ